MKKARGVIYLFLVALLATLLMCGSTPKKESAVIFVFNYGGQSYVLKESDLKVESDIHTVELDMQVRNSLKTYEDKRKALARLETMGVEAGEGIKYLYPLLEKKLEKIISKVEREPKPARLKFYPDEEKKFAVVEAVDGRRVDRQRLFIDIERAYKKNKLVNISIVTLAQKHEFGKKEALEGAHLISRFSTSYEQSAQDRKHNVRLALKKFNGMRIEAGEAVSFNKVVGARTSERGYREAKIILNGAYEDGVGGGVCQSSTTLYNAALLADMEILEAHQHSLRIGYVEPSFDAMVNSSGGDLRFKNNSDLPVFIRTFFNEQRVSVEFYGRKLPYRIERESKITERKKAKDEHIIDYDQKYVDKAPYKGEKVRILNPKDGIKSEGALLYYDSSGKQIARKLIRKNSYAPQNGLTVEGIKERPAPIEPQNNNNLNPPFQFNPPHLWLIRQHPTASTLPNSENHYPSQFAPPTGF